MEFKFSGRILFQDYIQFYKFIVRKSFFAQLIVFIFLLLACFIIGLYEFLSDFSIKFAPILMTLLLIYIVYTIIYLFLLKKRLKKIFYSNKTIEEECHYIVDEKSIRTISESSNSVLSEEKIFKLIFYKDSIFVFFAMNMAYIIKKRFFNTDEEYQNLVLFIKENYKSRIGKK